MSTLDFTILTQHETPLDLSRPAIMWLLAKLGYLPAPYDPLPPQASGEIENFRNLLLNLLERSEPAPAATVDNSDLVS